MCSEGYGSCPVCVCVCVSTATQQTGHTNGLSTVLAPELIWRFFLCFEDSYSVSILKYVGAHSSRPSLYAKRAHFPHSFR